MAERRCDGLYCVPGMRQEVSARTRNTVRYVVCIRSYIHFILHIQWSHRLVRGIVCLGHSLAQMIYINYVKSWSSSLIDRQHHLSNSHNAKFAFGKNKKHLQTSFHCPLKEGAPQITF